MSPDIQKAVESGKLTAAQGTKLDKLEAGSFVLHKSWGFGQIEAVDFLLNQMTIHFKGKRSHPMRLGYGADSLQPIPADHILARKSTDLAGTKDSAKNDTVGFMRTLLQNYAGKLTQDQISQLLVPDVFAETEFKKWWENAKRALKKDGHFAIPTKKNDPVVLRDAPVSRVDEHLVSFNEARQLKDQIAALERIVKDVVEFTDPAGQLQPIILAVEDAARKNAKLRTNEALQLILARDEIVAQKEGLQSSTPTVASILKDEERQLRTLLSEVPAAKLKRVLAELPKAFPEDWVSKALDLVVNGNSRVVGETARLLQERGHTEDLRVGLDRAIRDHSISSAALTWLCDKRERKGEFIDLIHPRVLSAMLGAMERDQFLESRDRKLHDLLVNDKELIVDLLSEASPEELREVMQKLILSTIFEELNKRSLLGRIVRVYPEMQAMITGDTGDKQEVIIVSWASLERRKSEYEELVTKKIPQNTQEIAVARAHGDLRENFEFKAAKDMQRVLMRRRAETERDLALARGTDFANPDLGQVSIGTTVTVRNVSDGTTEVYSILGAWDSDPDQGIISYQAAIAQALLGHKVGQQVQVPTEHGDKLVEIVSIAACDRLPAIPVAGEVEAVAEV